MNNSFRRSADHLTNRLLFSVHFHWKQLLLGNRKVALHPCNHSTNSIFIHIPKTAGFSVAQAIYGMDPWHFRLRDYRQVCDTDEYFTFAVVREPAARLSSMYRYLRHVRTVPPPLADCRLAPDFRSFLEEYIYQMKSPTDPFLYSQLDYLVDDNDEIAVDFVAKMENLEHDFDYIRQRTNRGSVTLPHLNRSPEPHDISADDLNYVKRVFAAEYARLGYADA